MNINYPRKRLLKQVNRKSQRQAFSFEKPFNLPMIKLNIEQQTDEIRDIENFIREFDPIAVVELQSQQVRRLVYFAKKGIKSYREYKARLNPTMNHEINIDGDNFNER